MKSKKFTVKTVALMLVMVTMLGMFVQAFAVYDTPTFSDVPREFWGYTYIEQAAEKGWVKGMGGGKFEPNGKVTYAQFATMLDQAFFKDEVDSYGVTNPWFTRFCNIAGEKGLFAGTEAENYQNAGSYANRQMSRYEMAQVVYNTMSKINAKMPSSKEVAAQIDTTPDFFDIPSKYSIAVLTAKASGIISGMGGGRFEGDGTLTRAQTCVVLIKLDNLAGTGDGTGGDTEPSGPVEIDRSPFAFKDGENVQQMMDRLNAEAPKYYKGYLTNGKPVTEANIKEMLAAAEKSMPSRTKWDESSFYNYGTRAYENYMNTHACSAFAGALSDYIFGKDAPAITHQDFDNIKVGDIIGFNDSSTGFRHAVLVVGLCPTTTDSLLLVEGNMGGEVLWNGYDYKNTWSSTLKAESYIYSRY